MLRSRHAALTPIGTLTRSIFVCRSFSTSPILLLKRQKAAPLRDRKITLLRYFLHHPTKHVPSPLWFSRHRYLRHWTIHRAWQLFSAKQRKRQQLELERQYNSMRDACEHLRLIDGNGMMGAEAGPDVGRLYRMAMSKGGVFRPGADAKRLGSGTGIPIEYARLQTETPPKNGWNYDWKR